MVLNKELKQDVFSSYHLNKQDGDNEDRSEALDEIVKKSEKRLRKEDLKKGGESQFILLPRPSNVERALSKNSANNHSRLLSRPAGIRRAFTRDSRDSGDSHLAHSSGRSGENHFRHSNRQVPSQLDANMGSGGNNLHSFGAWEAGEIDSNVHMEDGGESNASTTDHVLSKKKKYLNSSRSGTTVTAILEEEEGFDDSEDGGFSTVVVGDMEEAEKVGDDDDDDDSHISGISPTRRRSAISRSSTGQLIGGMVASDAADESDYSWISPHEADTIFSDFERGIDSAVQEYEKIHREIFYGTSTDDKDDEEENNEHNKHNMDIKVRYQTFSTLWMVNFPRLHAIFVRILLPFVIIILITIVLGMLLGTIEIGDEINRNDEIMRRRHGLNDYPYDDTINLLYALPTLCSHHYLDKMKRDQLSNNNSFISNSINRNKTIDAEYKIGSISNAFKRVGFKFPPVSSEFDSDPFVTISEIESYTNDCKDAGNEIVKQFIEYTIKKVNDASESDMSFQWMRCWDTTIYGNVNPWYPSEKQLTASKNQAEFYAEFWKINQNKLYEQNLEQNCKNNLDTSCHDVALEQSMAKATGSEICATNKGASAWFWFVFMTTVGYGNVYPTTIKGRALSGTIGFFTIIIWAVLLFIAGKVVRILIEDLFRRCKCRVMTGNVPSALVWSLFSVISVAAIAQLYMQNNFREQVHDLNFLKFNYTASDIGEAFWFSYISLTTVGLGDFTLGPESFFYNDLFIWTFSFLTGFTFLATTLGHIADLTNNLFPDSGDALRNRLLNTNLVGKKEAQYKKENEKGIEKLERLVEVMDDDDLELITQRVTRIRFKKNLLVHLLHQTKKELEYYKKRGERYDSLSYADVVIEENMLNEVTRNTTKEREKLESYRDGGVLNGPTMPYLSKKGNSMELLKVGKCKKHVQKKIRASWYI